jgi:hypothetical protein
MPQIPLLCGVEFREWVMSCGMFSACALTCLTDVKI